MSEDVTSCAKCKKLPQNILMMACSHDFCLDCSAERLAMQLKVKIEPNSIVCQICMKRTQLNPSTIVELMKIVNNNAKKMLYSPKVVKKAVTPKIDVPFEKKEEEVADSHILGSLPSQLNLSKETLAIFAREKIDTIETLALLTEEDYKELKIPMGERKRLLKAFNK